MAYVRQKFAFGAAGRLCSIPGILDLRFGPFAISDIACVTLDAFWLSIAVNDACAYFQRDAAAALRHNLQFIRGGAAFRLTTSKYLASQFEVFRPDKLRQVQLEGFLT